MWVPSLALAVSTLFATQVESFASPTVSRLANHQGILKAVPGSACGCDTLVSGNPSVKARSIDPREAVRSASFYTVNGERTNMDDLIGKPTTKATSIVVFMRSLG